MDRVFVVAFGLQQRGQAQVAGAQKVLMALFLLEGERLVS